jgi:crotonobetainyl-CoA:carnitine CoA-transferase CaiB-like acyl-CoA transferase
VKPLADLRIVAIEQYGAGPFGSVHLADLGAEVIKIEEPASGGDVGRYVPPYQRGEDSLFFEVFNRNKRSVSLDLSTTVGREAFHDLVRVSDVVYSNLRGDVPATIGITYDDLKSVNPRIVCCALTGFGMTGPRAAEPGYDYVLQGIAGWMDITGERTGHRRNRDCRWSTTPEASSRPSRSLPAFTRHAVTAPEWTATSAFSTRPSRC